ncbi:hypothetical protein M3Y94_00808800 [Aphelenchoides besseyi]|nr:hypothetical protein M3Y94_00808800 [Aphelenchoides besseyi]
MSTLADSSSRQTSSDLNDDEKTIFAHIQEGRTDEAIELIRSGKVRINCLDSTGMNFVDQAAFKGNEKLMEVLLEGGGDADNRNHAHGYTCLMFAALSGKPRVCELLLNAGARSYATNNLNKTAAEMAAFVGNFECVSMINSYISNEDVEKLVHPNGEKSDQMFPQEFVDYIHELTRTHLIHPVSIAQGLANRLVMLKYRKKLLYVVDRLFERQLRSKQPNEIMALKLWMVLSGLREIINFVNKSLPETLPFDESACVLSVNKFIKTLVEWKNIDNQLGRRPAGFPYQHSVVFKALAQSFRSLKFGRAPNSFVLICATIFGQRYAQSGFCSFCGRANAAKCCSICKVIYCSAECQKVDWTSHKKVCELLKQNTEMNAYTAPNLNEMAYLSLNDDEESKTKANN